MASPAERIAHARARLVAAGLPDEDAAIDAEVLARHVLAWDRARLLAHGREPAPQDFAAKFDALVGRRARREPVAQIVSHREFWNLDFEVTRDVLIPRPETEAIVEEALIFARERPVATAIDVGTGSGCLAVSIARDLPALQVTATDRSEAALAVARRNAARHGVSDRVAFLKTDLLNGIDGRVDLIVSNPPYVPDRDAASLPPEVRDFEPHEALFGGPDGLVVIRRLLHSAHNRLADAGRLIVEFGLGQDPAVRRLAVDFKWNVVRVRQDLQGIPRTVVLSRSTAS